MAATIPFHTISGDTSVQEVLEACPEAAAVLAAFDLDACCGGGLPLSDACEDAGAALDDVLRALRRAWSGP